MMELKYGFIKYRIKFVDYCCETYEPNILVFYPVERFLIRQFTESLDGGTAPLDCVRSLVAKLASSMALYTQFGLSQKFHETFSLSESDFSRIIYKLFSKQKL